MEFFFGISLSRRFLALFVHESMCLLRPLGGLQFVDLRDLLYALSWVMEALWLLVVEKYSLNLMLWRRFSKS